MEITEEDLNNILENGGFVKEDKNILIDFCNSFQQIFSDFVDKDEFLNRISTLRKIQYEHKGEKADASYSQNGTLTINDDVHGNKRKSIIYHELMHLISMHLPRENPESGKVQGFKIGSVDMNEIMTEYFATRLLLYEGIEDLKGKYYIKSKDGIEEYVEYDGTGYPPAAKLGELYHKIFGQEIVDGYFNNAIKFQERFNEKYKFLEDREGTAMENAVYLWDDVYKNYGNALRIFMTNENEKLNSGTLTVYDYLKESKPIRDCLPVRKDTKLAECEIVGIPSGVEKFLMRLDERFVAQFIRPDVVGKPQDDDALRKKKDFFIALNAIRDNIEHLSPEDLEKIDMNFHYEPSNSNMEILVNGKLIQVFTDGETYLGTNEIEREHIQNPVIDVSLNRTITPTQITNDTINIGIGIEEANEIASEIRKMQTRDKQQSQEYPNK